MNTSIPQSPAIKAGQREDHRRMILSSILECLNGYRIFCTDDTAWELINPYISIEAKDEWTWYTSFYLPKASEHSFKDSKHKLYCDKLSNNAIQLLDEFWHCIGFSYKEPAYFLLSDPTNTFELLDSHKKTNFYLGDPNKFAKLIETLRPHNLIYPNASMEEAKEGLSGIVDLFFRQTHSDGNSSITVDLPKTNYNQPDAYHSFEQVGTITTNDLEDDCFQSLKDTVVSGLKKHKVLIVGGFHMGCDFVSRTALREFAVDQHKENLVDRTKGLLINKQLNLGSAINEIKNGIEDRYKTSGTGYIFRNFFDPEVHYWDELSSSYKFINQRDMWDQSLLHTEGIDGKLMTFIKFINDSVKHGEQSYLIFTTQYDSLDSLVNAIIHLGKSPRDVIEKYSNIQSLLISTLANKFCRLTLPKVSVEEISRVKLNRWFRQHSRKMRPSWTDNITQLRKYASIGNSFRPALWEKIINHLLVHCQSPSTVADAKGSLACFQQAKSKYEELHSIIPASFMIDGNPYSVRS